MKYRKFKIHSYKGIRNQIEIDLSKLNLMPIIGVNECGKTTILEALLAFDYINDKNYGGRHLSHIQNMYGNTESNIIISAEIEYDESEIERELKRFLDAEMAFDPEEHDEDQIEDKNNFKSYLLPLIEQFQESTTIEIFRRLDILKYSFSKSGSTSKYEHKLCSELVRLSPYMLYFDDFHDDFNGIVEYKNYQNSDDETVDVSKKHWYRIVNKLFEDANTSFSLSKLSSSGDLKKNIISDVNQHLNKIIDKSWENFSLEKGPQPEIDIIPLTKDRLKFEIIETITLANGEPRYRTFGIKERSKGFYWFFNFIMKLHFNPQKRYQKDRDTIYLLDEPGSYLHSTAQKNLLDQLTKISEENKVIFSTHSPFLLDPKKIPIKDIRISSKSDINGIELHNFATAPMKLGGVNSPFQIILHYLEITPISLNFNKDRIVIVEGIFDYYWLDMLKGKRKINFFPSSNADSIQFHISYMIADSKNYSVLWDNDAAGKRAFKKSEERFGVFQSKKWCLLPLFGRSKTVIENLVANSDKDLLSRELNIELNKPSSFKKAVALLYHNSRRASILKKISPETIDKFNTVFDELENRLSVSSSIA